MNVRRILPILALLSSGVARAEQGSHEDGVPAPAEAALPDAAPAECRFVERALKSKMGIGNHSLDFFISVAGNRVYYITGQGNRVQNLGSSISRRVPGDIDPVPTPDGKWVVIPGPLRFFAAERVGSGVAGAFTRIADFTDDSMKGVYQSIGVLPSEGSDSAYRVITDNDGVSVQDYQVTPPGGRRGFLWRRRNFGHVSTVHGQSGHELCPELPTWNKQLPMLSKDGRLLSLYNMDERTTKIYEIQDGTWACKEVLSLGFPTGKVDFSPDGNKIAFHMDSFAQDSNFFSGVHESMTKDIYTVELAKDGQGKINGAKSISRLSYSGTKGSGTYYPRWSGNDQLVAARDEGNQFSIATFDPAKGQEMPFWTPSSSKAPTADTWARFALGALLQKTCSTRGFVIPTVTESSFAALSLDPASCKELVRKYWDAARTEMLEKVRQIGGSQGGLLEEINQDAVLAACPQGGASSSPVQTIGSIAPAQINAQSIVAGRCQQCHTGGYQSPTTGLTAPAINFTQPLSPAQVQSIKTRLNLPRDISAHMPPPGAGQLDAAEEALLRQYLDGQ